MIIFLLIVFFRRPPPLAPALDMLLSSHTIYDSDLKIVFCEHGLVLG